MARELLYTAVDIGSTKVATIIAKIGPEGELKVLGQGISPSQGVQKGRVENLAETQEAVKKCLEEAQRYLGRGVTWAYLAVTGNQASCLNTTGTLKGSGRDGTISPEDLGDLIQSSCPDVSDGKEVLHVIPIRYTVDGLGGIRSPVGLHADRVQVESHVIVGDAPILKNLVRTVERCKLSVRSTVLQPLAAAEVVLTEDEREIGSVLVDMGGGTTDVVIFRSGNPWYTSVIPVGGNQLTRDLSVALGVPFFIAEELKTKWGHSLPDTVSADDEVQVPGFQGQTRRMVKRRGLCQPLHERLAETLKLVLFQVRQSGLRHLPPGGLVITGGGAEMAGLQQLAREITDGPARIGYPTGILGLPSQLRKPAMSAAVGTLLWGIKHHGEKRPHSNGHRATGGRRTLAPLFRFRKKGQEAAV